MRPSALVAVLASALAAAIVCPPPVRANHSVQKPVNRQAKLQVEFLERVKAYMAVRETARRRASEQPPNPNVSAAEMLARYIAQERRRAQRGDLFTSEFRPYVRQQIARALAGPDGRRIRASIMDENPGLLAVRINGRYPDSAPLASMPPQILEQLPTLPTGLEYRFLGRRLLLLDADAHLVVDFMENALQG